MKAKVIKREFYPSKQEPILMIETFSDGSSQVYMTPETWDVISQPYGESAKSITPLKLTATP